MKLDNGRSFQNNLFYEQKAFHVTVRWLVKGKYSLTGQIRIGKRDTSVGSVQIHAVHTISQGALQNTDTIPVKFPNILPKQIRIKDIVLHGVGKRTQFSRYITLEIWRVITNKFENLIAQVIRCVFQIGRHISKGRRETSLGRLVEIFLLLFFCSGNQSIPSKSLRFSWELDDFFWS